MPHSLQQYRRRLAARGFKRVELCVSGVDTELVRRVAKALAKDDALAARLRTALHEAGMRAPVKFQEWLGLDEEPLSRS